MLPTTLELNAFLSYLRETVDLDGLGLAAVAGRNGDGKSSLIEAIVFALWGHSRYRGSEGPNYERLIRHGSDAMSVSLTFRVGASTYRVKRSRTRKGGGSLEFYQVLSTNEEPLTRGKMADTQALINATVGMDLKTFTASSLLLQGQAGTFTAGMDDKGRKQMLVDILDLDRYPRLATAAKDRGNLLDAALSASRDRLRVLDQVPAQIAEAEALLGARREEREKASQDLSALRGALSAAEEAVKASEAAGVRVRDLERLLSRLAEEHRVALDEAEARMQSARQGREKEVKARQAVEFAAVVERGKVARTGLNEKQDLLDKLAPRKRRLESDLASIPTVPPLLVQDLEQQVAADVALAAQVEAWWKEFHATQGTVMELQHRHSCQLLSAQNDLKCTRALASKLEEDVACIDLPRARCRFMGDANEAAARLPEVEAALAAIQALRPAVNGILRTVPESPWAEAEARWYEVKALIDGAGYDKHAAAERQKALDTARVNAARADQRSDLIRQVAEVAEEMREIEAALPAWREDLNALLGEAETLKQKHRDELHSLTVYHDHEDNDERERLRKGYEAKAVPLRFDLEEAREAIPPFAGDCSHAALRVSVAEKNLAALDRDLGALEATLAHLRESLAEGEALREKVAADAAEVGEWQLLARLLDPKTGVPVELMRTAIPELEARANHWLSRLTGGGMSVALVTEVDLKKGGEKDVLRIEVSHEGFTQPYEGFSGGQRTRVDAALRLAISQLLASRRGVKLECLILDEPTSALDADGRDALLEVLEVCATEFALVLVVSHAEDVCSRLPARLEVVKDGTGSHVRRAA